jgi:hypothetical protein
MRYANGIGGSATWKKELPAAMNGNSYRLKVLGKEGGLLDWFMDAGISDARSCQKDFGKWGPCRKK